MNNPGTMQLLPTNEGEKAEGALYRLSDRIIAAKIRMLCEHTFFGLLLQHVIFAVDTDIPTACTDGNRIYFGQAFAEKLDNDGLYYVLMHEVLHIVLGHCIRGKAYDSFIYNVAADIVVNSNIIKELGAEELDLGFAGKLMHIAPNGREGYHYTAEEVYDMLYNTLPRQKEQDGQGAPNGEDANQSARSKSNSPSDNGDNSDDTEGKLNKKQKKQRGQEQKEAEDYQKQLDERFKDDHSRWGKVSHPEELEERWKLRVQAAAKTVAGLNQGGWGNEPSLAQRLLEKIEHPAMDWRVLLNNFIQEETTDYSFSPPDRRFSDSPFLLPDFNEREDCIKNVWVAVDASGSVSNYELALAVNEIDGAISQYGGRFEGWLSFFDYEVTKPAPFSSTEELRRINVLGGGGTSFINVLKYRREKIDFQLSCIIIITDGGAEWPSEALADGIPVLWVLNNNRAKPPWGAVAVISR